MAHFYLVEELDSAAPGDTVEVRGPEAKHIASVARTRVGEGLLIGNGRGLVVAGTARTVAQTLVTLAVESVRVSDAAGPAIRLAQALAKGDRDELAVQAATELGVDGVVPWQAARSVPRWIGEKAARGRERWAALVREASKQAMRPWLPEVAPLAGTAQLIAAAGERREQLVVLEPTADRALSAIAGELAALVGGPGRVLLVVGPEGGISDDELAAFAASGALLARLGDTVLRTSTAGPAALAVLNVALGRW